MKETTPVPFTHPEWGKCILNIPTEELLKEEVNWAFTTADIEKELG